ncbi:MAG: DUF6090 family protein [Cyclobacteriaceae bacterium]
MNSKFTTYLLYGIGEIILVVVGILIAVNIDEWNEQKQRRALEIKYLKELKGDLEFDLKDIQYNVDFNLSTKNSNDIVLRHLRADLPYHDSLAFHFSNLMFSTRTIPKNSAYESLKSKGLEIISNDSLRSEISRIYAVSFHNAIDFETKDDHPFQFHVLWPEVISAIEIDSVGKAAKPINYAELKSNTTFKNAISVNLSYRAVMLDTYTELKEQVSSLIAFIEEDLKRLEK